MASRFEKFSERARRVITLAQTEAYNHNHNYIGAEHLLLGLVSEEEGVAAKVLVSLGADLAKIRSGVEFIIGRGEKPNIGEIGLTPRAKRVIELAIDEGLHLGHGYVGTEHILLGLLHEGGGVAAGVLDSFGITLEKARCETIKILNQMSSKQARTTKPSKLTPTLDQFSVDLTALAHTDKLDPIIGREIEIQRVMQILNRRTKNNPALIGNPGVGKTAIVRGLAQRISKNNVPDFLQDKRLLMLDIDRVMAGSNQSEREEQLKKLVDEIKSGNVIIFVNELQTIANLDPVKNADYEASILKRLLAEGQLQIIGATTPENYRMFIESNPALESQFLSVLVKEPTIEQTLEILIGVRKRYEEHHKLEISDTALNSAILLASRYIPDRFLPDKAIDLIDEAASMVRIQKGNSSPTLKEAKRLAEVIRKEKETALAAQQYDYAAEKRQKEIGIEEKIKVLEKEQQEKELQDKLIVTEDEIATLVSMWTGIPVTQLSDKKEK